MYKEHKIIALLIFILVCITSALINVNYGAIASDSINVAAISSALYLAVLAGIQGSCRLNAELNKKDDQFPDSTQRQVIINYVKRAFTWSIITIVLSVVVQIIIEKTTEFEQITLSGGIIANLFYQWKNTPTPSSLYYLSVLKRIISAFAMGAFGLNIFFMIMMGIFVVNRIMKDR